MDTVFTALLSWQFLIFCLGIAAIIFVVRKLVEYFILENPKLPGSKDSRIWTELFLPIAPVCTGALVALVATKYPYPQGIESVSGRILFGLVAGFLSGLVYRVLKGMLNNAINNNNNNGGNSGGITNISVQ